jgi:predicted nuclease of predicted toxin-antitoxin system
LKILIDECLSTGLVALCHEAGHEASHVAWLGKSGWKDWQLIRFVVDENWTFVTNNAVDFRNEHGRVELHTGLIIILPQLVLSEQRAVFRAVLAAIAGRDLTNLILEVDVDGGEIVIEEYALPA